MSEVDSAISASNAHTAQQQADTAAASSASTEQQQPQSTGSDTVAATTSSNDNTNTSTPTNTSSTAPVASTVATVIPPKAAPGWYDPNYDVDVWFQSRRRVRTVLPAEKCNLTIPIRLLNSELTCAGNTRWNMQQHHVQCPAIATKSLTFLPCVTLFCLFAATAVCLGIIRNCTAICECLHRFCADCIENSLRYGKKECPQCKLKAQGTTASPYIEYTVTYPAF